MSDVKSDLRDSKGRLEACAAHWREWGEPDGNSDYGIRLMEFTAERIGAILAFLDGFTKEDVRMAEALSDSPVVIDRNNPHLRAWAQSLYERVTRIVPDPDKS